MKTNTLGTLAVLMMLSLAAGAQDLTSPVIKVLPTDAPAAIKLLVVQNDGSSVQVRFYGDQGTIASDEIIATRAGKGFLKRYDFQKVSEKAFWMAIKTSNSSVIYKITRSRDRIDAQLAESTQTYPVVVAVR